MDTEPRSVYIITEKLPDDSHVVGVFADRATADRYLRTSEVAIDAENSFSVGEYQMGWQRHPSSRHQVPGQRPETPVSEGTQVWLVMEELESDSIIIGVVGSSAEAYAYMDFETNRNTGGTFLHGNYTVGWNRHQL